LRLFNDCFAMLFAYVSVLAATHRRWTLSTIALSLGVSIKMNVLLFAPAGLLLLWRTGGFLQMVTHGILAGVIQIALGAPFLSVAPADYVSRAFDLGRVFLHQWTVNWQFLPEHVFVSRTLAIALLAAHAVVLVVLAVRWWPVLHNPTPRRTFYLQCGFFPLLGMFSLLLLTAECRDCTVPAHHKLCWGGCGSIAALPVLRVVFPRVACTVMGTGDPNRDSCCCAGRHRARLELVSSVGHRVDWIAGRTLVAAVAACDARSEIACCWLCVFGWKEQQEATVN
jgi:hypothetical protein